MENDLLECFPCRVTQYTYRRRVANPKDRREDRSRRKKVKHHYKGKFNEHVSDPLYNSYKMVVFLNLRPHFTRCIASNVTHTPHMEPPYDKTVTDPFGNMEFHTKSIDTEPNILNVSFVSR